MGRKTPAADPADALLDRVRSICHGFAGAEEKLSHGAPWFHVKGKMFLAFVEGHPEGRLSVWCKAEPDAQRRLVAGDPGRFYVPPYVGVKGWVGAWLDIPQTDFIELAILVEDAWRSIVPKSIALLGTPRDRKKLPAPVRVKTDPEVAKRAYEKLSALCLALPEAVADKDGRHATFRVRNKVFVYFLDNHHGEGTIVACVKTPKTGRESNAKLLARDPEHFTMPAYIGPRGYVGVRLEPKRVDWDDLAERVRASYVATAPKTLAAALHPGAIAKKASAKKNAPSAKRSKT
jgi:hypothetical protein